MPVSTVNDVAGETQTGAGSVTYLDPAHEHRAKLEAEGQLGKMNDTTARFLGLMTDTERTGHQDDAAALADTLAFLDRDMRIQMAGAALDSLKDVTQGEVLDIYRHALTQPRTDCEDGTDDCAEAPILSEADWNALKDSRLKHAADERRKAKADRYQDFVLDLADLTEVVFTDRVCTEELEGAFVFAPAFGWMLWTGTHWVGVGDHVVAERVRKFTAVMAAQQLSGGATGDKLKAVMAMMKGGFVRNVTGMARGVLAVDDDMFDRHADLLNVLNGVVDLRTGDLKPHDPTLYFTKVAPTAYRKGAKSAVLDAVLASMDAEVRDWMQLRMGNAVTGHAPDDDRVAFLNGAGGNGKSIVLRSVSAALGIGRSGYYMAMSDDLLLSDRDAKEERMSLRGARFAVVEELPEAKRLNVTMLKKLAGSENMTSRHLYKSEVTFQLVATIFITANYDPQVVETDNGTWRRIAKVPFPYTYTDTPTAPHHRKRDGKLAAALRTPEVTEAMLTWLVEGAVRWYREHLMIDATPADVVEATDTWRATSDSVLSFYDGRLIKADGYHVAMSDLLAVFNGQMKADGQGEWSAKTLASRFGTHTRIADNGITMKSGVRPGGVAGVASRPGDAYGQPLGKQYAAMIGVRFRTDEDDNRDGEQRGGEQPDGEQRGGKQPDAVQQDAVQQPLDVSAVGGAGSDPWANF